MAEPTAAQGPRPVAWPAPERVSLASSGVVGQWPARTSIVLIPDSLAVAPTHWRLGAIVGGTVFGTLGAGTAVALCQSDNPCRAPSAELYLKHLAVLATGDCDRGHDLLDLYNALPAHVREVVGRKYSGAPPLADVLTAHRDTFVQWRYIFENQEGTFSLDFQSLVRLDAALEAAALELGGSDEHLG